MVRAIVQRSYTPAQLSIPLESVRALAQCGPSTEWNGQIVAAIDEARTLVRPRGQFVRLERGAGPDLFSGGNTPVEAIARAGEAVWAFVATIGDRLEKRARERMDQTHFLEGTLLDAVGSTAVESVCDLLQAELEKSAEPAQPECSCERYSPGYCMWSLDAQPTLFELLEPDAIGISLMPSRLMCPLKSVSGIVVRGLREQLRVPASYCAVCPAPGCGRRQHASGNGN